VNELQDLTPSELVDRLITISGRLDEANTSLERSAEKKAATEWAYRKAKAQAILEVGGNNGDVREARVTQFEVQITVDRSGVLETETVTVGELRYRRDLAEGVAQAKLEIVRSKRGELSALQTVANAKKEEAMLARTGPE
jgi:hypothetical protein